MAYLQDYNEDERRLQQQTSGPGQSYAPASGSGAPSAAPASSGMSPAPIAAYFSANEPAAQSMAAGIGSRVEEAGRDAVQSWDAGKAADAWGRAERLGTQEGVASELDDAYQDPQYTPGMASLDAYLTRRGSTPGQYDELVNRFAGLDVNEVGSAAPTAPTMRDVGPEPKLEGMSRNKLSGELQAPSPYHKGGKTYHDVYLPSVDRHKAWEKQRAGAQSEYDEANKQFGEDTEIWNKKRQPFLDAFGL